MAVAIIASLFVGGGALVWHNTPPSKENSPGAKRQARATQDHPTTIPALQHQKGGNEGDRTRDSSENANEIVARYTVRLTYVTGALALFAGLQLIFIYLAQRAYLSVEPGGISPFRTRARHPCEVLGHVEIRNAGRSSARKVRWCTFIECSDHRDRKDFPIDPSKFGGFNILPPSTTMIQGTETVPSTEFMQMDGAPPRYCYVWGEVRYKNGFGVPRFIRFCHRYNCEILIESGGTRISRRQARHHREGNDAN